MILNSIIIHQIKKETGTTNNSEVYKTTSVLDKNNASVKKIINSLEESFSKKTLKRSKFSEDGFKNKINNFNNINIIDSSSTLIDDLQSKINNIPQAKGGYLVFAEYTTNQDFLAVFLVRNTDGSKLTASEGSWDLDTTQYLDVEHFAMGAKINLTILNSQSSDRYISLIKGNTDISGYFEAWIGIDDTKQENKDAKALYNISTNINLPEGMTDRDNLKKMVFAYVKGRSDKIVNLHELSQYIYNDRDYISNYCQDNEIDIDGEFKINNTNLKRFYSISATVDGIALSAPRSSFNKDMISFIDGKVIINSAELVQRLQAEMNSSIDE